MRIAANKASTVAFVYSGFVCCRCWLVNLGSPKGSIQFTIGSIQFQWETFIIIYARRARSSISEWKLSEWVSGTGVDHLWPECHLNTYITSLHLSQQDHVHLVPLDRPLYLVIHSFYVPLHLNQWMVRRNRFYGNNAGSRWAPGSTLIFLGIDLTLNNFVFLSFIPSIQRSLSREWKNCPFSVLGDSLREKQREEHVERNENGGTKQSSLTIYNPTSDLK